MTIYQLDLFLTDEYQLLKQKIDEESSKSKKMCRGLFARHNELCRLYLDQQKEIDELRRMIKKDYIKPIEIDVREHA